jgi:RNA-directed DNA polymerase
LANIFLHLAFDQWMGEEHADVPFERYADDIVVHCRTKEQAEGMQSGIEERLRRCRLQLHSEKTRVVCCDPKTEAQYKQFDFLGFRFQPRLAKSKVGAIFATFSPAISPKAAQGVRETIRRVWRLPQRTEMSLNDLAELMNPALVGWINYYGKFRASALVSVFRRINMALRLWAMRKYKRYKGRPQKAMTWLRDIALRDRGLIAHWKIAGLTPTVAGR